MSFDERKDNQNSGMYRFDSEMIFGRDRGLVTINPRADIVDTYGKGLLAWPNDKVQRTGPPRDWKESLLLQALHSSVDVSPERFDKISPFRRA